MKLHEFKGGVGEGEGGADGDRKVVSVDHGQSTTTRGTWKRPQLVARQCQVDTLTLVAVSFHPCLCQKQYVNTFIFHEFHNFCTFLFGPNWLGVEDRNSESFVVLTGVDTNQITLFLVMGVGRRKRLSCGGVWVRRVVLEVRLGRNGVDGWWTDRSITAIDPHTDLPRLIPPVLRSSFVSWNRSVGRRRDDGSNLSSSSGTNKSTTPLNRRTNLVDKAKQAYCSAKIQSSTTCKQLLELQHHSVSAKTFLRPAKTFLRLFLQGLALTTSRMSFLITSPKKSAPSEFFFFLQTSSLHWYLFRWKSLANFWACRWWICLKNNQQCTREACDRNLIPATFLCENLDILLPTITNIINTSLTTWSEDCYRQTCWKRHQLINIFFFFLFLLFTGPAYLSEPLHVYTPSRTLCSSSDTRQKSFALSLALDPTFGIHSHKTLPILSYFKAKQKTFLFTQYFLPIISVPRFCYSQCVCVWGGGGVRACLRVCVSI